MNTMIAMINHITLVYISCRVVRP